MHKAVALVTIAVASATAQAQSPAPCSKVPESCVGSSVKLLGTDQHDQAVATIMEAVARAEKKRAVTLELLKWTTVVRRSIPADSELAKKLHALAQRHVPKPTKKSSAAQRAVFEDLAADLIDDRAPSRFAAWRAEAASAMGPVLVSSTASCRELLGVWGPPDPKVQPTIAWRAVSFDGTCVQSETKSQTSVPVVQPYKQTFGKTTVYSGQQTVHTTSPTYKTSGAGSTTMGDTTYSSSCNSTGCYGSSTTTTSKSTYDQVPVVRNRFRLVQGAQEMRLATISLEATIAQPGGSKVRIGFSKQSSSHELWPVIPEVRASLMKQLEPLYMALYAKRVASLRAKKKSNEALDVAVFGFVARILDGVALDFVLDKLGTDREYLDLLAAQQSMVPLVHPQQRRIASPPVAAPVAVATPPQPASSAPKLASLPAPLPFTWRGERDAFTADEVKVTAERFNKPCAAKRTSVIGNVDGVEIRNSGSCYQFVSKGTTISVVFARSFRSLAAEEQTAQEAAEQHLVAALTMQLMQPIEIKIPRGAYAWYEP